MEQFPHHKPSLLRALEAFKVTTDDEVHRRVAPLITLRQREFADQFREAEVVLLDRGTETIPNSISEEVIESANAMIECGVFKLPFPRCMFQLDTSVRHPSTNERIPLDLVLLVHQEADRLVWRMFVRSKQGSAQWHVFATHAYLPFLNGFEQHWFSNKVNEKGEVIQEDSVVDTFIQMVAKIAASHIVNIIVLMNTSWVPKNRYANGKVILKERAEPKHAYTLIEINQLLSAASSNGTVIEERQKVRLHLRRGHVRNQPYGPGKSLIKKIYVEAHLVGYEEQGVIVHDYKVR